MKYTARDRLETVEHTWNQRQELFGLSGTPEDEFFMRTMALEIQLAQAQALDRIASVLEGHFFGTGDPTATKIEPDEPDHNELSEIPY